HPPSIICEKNRSVETICVAPVYGAPHEVPINYAINNILEKWDNIWKEIVVKINDDRRYTQKMYNR
ncbi:uncharacterized protein BJ212DRAFT_1314322, partial [Suillus subaureus]